MNNHYCACGCGSLLSGHKNKKFATRRCKDRFRNRRFYHLASALQKALAEKGLEIRPINGTSPALPDKAGKEDKDAGY